MMQDEVIEIFKKCGALLNGHFKLSSGLHSPVYLEKFKVLQYPEYTSKLCKEIADRFRNDNIELVIGPATGGIIISYEVAKFLNVKSIFLEREQGKFVLRRGFSINKGEKVLVVEDIVTTGGSIKEVLDVVKTYEPDIIGIGMIIDRSVGAIKFDLRCEALATLNIETYEQDKCPLCKEGVPIVKPGSR